jgi:hypothetical protein
VQAHGLKTADYSLANLVDPPYLNEHRDRLGPSARELITQIGRVESWSYVVPLIVVGFAGALVLRRGRVVLFAAAWMMLSFAGLLAIYWISRNPVASHLFNTSDRTIVTLLIGGALLVPVLLAPERKSEPREL